MIRVFTHTDGTDEIINLSLIEGKTWAEVFETAKANYGYTEDLLFYNASHISQTVIHDILNEQCGVGESETNVVIYEWEFSTGRDIRESMRYEENIHLPKYEDEDDTL